MKTPRLTKFARFEHPAFEVERLYVDEARALQLPRLLFARRVMRQKPVAERRIVQDRVVRSVQLVLSHPQVVSDVRKIFDPAAQVLARPLLPAAFVREPAEN